MKIKIKSFEELTKKELYEILKLRSEIFVVEQHCFYLDPDGYDYHCHHLIVEENNEIVAYLRIIPKGLSYETPSIGRVLTAKDYRGIGASRMAMQTAIDFIKAQWKKDKITIGAQFYLENFYASLGFVRVSDVYLDAGIEHIDMVLDLKNEA